MDAQVFYSINVSPKVETTTLDCNIEICLSFQPAKLFYKLQIRKPPQVGEPILKINVGR